MAKPRIRSRLVLTALAVLVVAGALAAAFWPRATLVDMGEVRRGAMRLSIDEEGRTRVRDAYVVSTPVAGELQRVTVRPGDPVVRHETVIAHMHPTNPAALDVRTREQARAAVTAAEAALRVARADLNAAVANRDLAGTELQRTEQLAARNIESDAALDRARQAARVAQASVDTAEAAIAMREADLANAQAQLIGFDDPGLASAIEGSTSEDIPLLAPTDGRILQVFQQSATTLLAGTPILEIGDIAGDLEVVVELLSTDAVQVKPGDPVVITDWGGPVDLAGEVTRVDPFGVTRFSALGVEEQRVSTTIALNSPAEDYSGLGHGYRVEARIVVWQSDDALIVPSSALFRERDGWAVFRVEDGTARLTPVDIGPNNGLEAEVTGGLSEGDRVVLYPSSGLGEGARVAPRVTE